MPLIPLSGIKYAVAAVECIIWMKVNSKWVMFYGVCKKNLSDLWKWVYSLEKSGG